MNISAVDLMNALLATPLTKDGKIHILSTLMHQDATILDFLNECYVEPDFTQQASSDEEANNKPKCTINEYQDYEYANYVEDIGQRSNAFQKENFEKCLLGADIKDTDSSVYGTVFLIEGPAGCGKTTYAHKLLSQKFEIDLYDIDTATQRSCRFFGKPYDTPNKEKFDPIDALEISLLSGIHNRLARKENEDDNNRRNRLKQLCDIYNKFFFSELISTIDDEQYRRFFGVIHDYANNKSDYSQLTEKLHEQMKNDFGNHQSSSNKIIPRLKFLLGILMRVHICSSQIDKKKTIIFIDNLEKFIFSENGKPYMKINDSHLQKIICSIYSVSDETQDLVLKILNALEIDKSKYYTSFGILIAVREFTLSLVKKNVDFMKYFESHHAEKMPTYVNIIKWFDYKQVFKRKIKYFTGLDVESDPKANVIIHTFDIILSDYSKSKWCLRNMFINMFNYNFRLFFANLTEAFFRYYDTIIFFNENWDKALKEKDYYKHLCRKLILRVALDYMQNNNIGYNGSDKFFDRLMIRCGINAPEKRKEKSTYARRILTYLDNKKIGQISSDKAMVSFPDLIETLLHKPIIFNDNNSVKRTSNVESFDPRFNDIAEILITAGETSKIRTNGIELITLLLDTDINLDIGTDIDEKKEILAAEIKIEWVKYIKNSRNYQGKGALKINPSGSVLAMLFSCFEFFACRYQPDLIPLLMMKKEEERKKLLLGHSYTGSDGKEKCVAGIVEHALLCVDSVIEYEKEFLDMGQDKLTYPKWLYKQSKDDKGIVHPIRILCEHINYLQAYRNFLSNYADAEYETEPYKNNKETGVVNQAINKYMDKLKEIISQYQSYVELGIVPKLDE